MWLLTLLIFAFIGIICLGVLAIAYLHSAAEYEAASAEASTQDQTLAVENENPSPLSTLSWQE